MKIQSSSTGPGKVNHIMGPAGLPLNWRFGGLPQATIPLYCSFSSVRMSRIQLGIMNQELSRQESSTRAAEALLFHKSEKLHPESAVDLNASG